MNDNNNEQQADDDNDHEQQADDDNDNEQLADDAVEILPNLFRLDME